MLRKESEIMSGWSGTAEPLLTISCITYNHESYVAQTIESFLMQVTTFPFEILIHDDASTDNTQAIIRSYAEKYPNIIRTILQKENYWMGKGINATTTIVWPASKGKYIAWCEGDDYWTDTFKLQKQVDFLEHDPSYSLTSHGYDTVNSKGEILFHNSKELMEQFPDGFRITSETIFDKWVTKTLTVVFRKDALPGNMKDYQHSYDTGAFYNILLNGDGYWMSFNAGAYRVHQSNSWVNNLQYKKFEKEYKTFRELYGYHTTRKALHQGVLRYNVYILKELIRSWKHIDRPGSKFFKYSKALIGNVMRRPASIFFLLKKINK